jgi:hypothetical protein
MTVTVLSDFSSSYLRNNSSKGGNHTPLIHANSSFSMGISLPSIMAVDSDLVIDFFRNLLENVRLFYDRNTSLITLSMKE